MPELSRWEPFRAQWNPWRELQEMEKAPVRLVRAFHGQRGGREGSHDGGRVGAARGHQ